jgi:hypothetical protein
MAKLLPSSTPKNIVPHMDRRFLARWFIFSASVGRSRRSRSNGSYSVQGAAALLGITPQTIFDWLRKGWLRGQQLARGMPWQISLSPQQAEALRGRVRRTNRFNGEAS